MFAVNATTSVGTVAAAGWKRLKIANVSDTIIYLKFDGSSPTLTTANGFPLPATTGTIDLVADDGTKGPIVQSIHGGVGNKELRVQYADS